MNDMRTEALEVIAAYHPELKSDDELMAFVIAKNVWLDSH